MFNLDLKTGGNEKRDLKIHIKRFSLKKYPCKNRDID